MKMPVSTHLLLFFPLFSVCHAVFGASIAGADAVEYYNADLDHYFVTTNSVEQATLDAGTSGNWQRTGLSFATGGSDPVCRFYGNTRIDPASGVPYGPNSHFYTVDANECTQLRALYTPNNRSWQYEGIAFNSTAAHDGQCSDGKLPVYRAYNNGAARGISTNHRLTADHASYLHTVASGWIAEGVTMCTPPPTNSSTCTPEELQALESAISAKLDAASTDADFTLLLKAEDGRSYQHARGTSSATMSHESASTSKLVAATIILDLVQRGYLSLDSRPQDFVAFWRPPAGHPANGVTLRHLLAFTSGFSDDPACLDLPGADFELCVRSIYLNNLAANRTPGSEFYYASSHLQIAGLMAIRARGLTSWRQLFDEFKGRSGLFSHSAFDLPSAGNPRLAGGMHWTGEDYLDFLRALQRGELLSSELRAEMWRNQRGTARVAHSPALEAIGQDWGYGFGNWVECAGNIFNCTGLPKRNSSPGTYGAYPFIDAGKGYIGLLARQGNMGSFANGYALFESVRSLANTWATLSCGDDPLNGR